MVAYALNSVAGININDAPSTSRAWELGQRVRLSDGSEWVYLAIAISTTIRQYDCCAITGTATTVAVTSTIGLTGVAEVIAQQAIVSDSANIQYMWFLVSNPLGQTTYKVKVAASCAINAKLATTAFAGTLDDTTAGTVQRVDGIVLTDSQPSGSSGSRTFRTAISGLMFDAV